MGSEVSGMSEIRDKESGMRIRFVKKWDIIPDPNPHAFTLAVCPHCLEQFRGTGASLRESSAHADALAADHKCSHLEAQESGNGNPSA